MVWGKSRGVLPFGFSAEECNRNCVIKVSPHARASALTVSNEPMRALRLRDAILLFRHKITNVRKVNSNRAIQFGACVHSLVSKHSDWCVWVCDSCDLLEICCNLGAVRVSCLL